MYNPQDDEGYLGEIFVRQEISRVFDVCLSCRKCVETCEVFPSLVESIERPSLSDAGMLTPQQQDEILDACHLCMQCVVQCPHGDIAPRLAESSQESRSSVHFPQLVIRHRAMLWSHGEIDFRQRYAALFLSYSSRLAHRIKIVRSVIAQLLIRRGASAPFVNGDVVIFPTCVVDKHHPQLADDFVSVCRSIDVGAARGHSFVCCGAPELYSGNFSRFRRIARRNSAVIARLASRGQTIVVGQSRCVSVMKEMYPSVARRKDAKNIFDNVVGMTEFLGQRFSSQPPAQLPQCTLQTRVVMLESSTQRLITALMSPTVEASDIGTHTVAAAQLLRMCGVQVESLKYSSFVDTEWSAQRRFSNMSVAEARKLADAIDGAIASDSHRIVLGESCLTNAFLDQTTGHTVEHPVSFLARQMREASPFR